MTNLSAVSSDVSSTVSFNSPVISPVTTVSVTFNLATHAPTALTDSLALGQDSGATSVHNISVNGLVAGTAYRYDIWVGSTLASSAPRW